jgi:hypothetical protein
MSTSLPPTDSSFPFQLLSVREGMSPEVDDCIDRYEVHYIGVKP